MNKLSTALIASIAATVSAHAVTLIGIDANNQLFSFDSSNPAAAFNAKPITGLKAIDGVTDDPYAQILNLARNHDANTYLGIDSNANIYSINVASGAASLLDNSFSPAGYDAGLAYDPFFGEYQWLSDAAENVKVSTTGSTSYGSDAFYGFSDVNELEIPAFTALGIDPFFGEAFAIDPYLDIIAQSFDPNFEEFFTFVDLGIDVTGYSSMTIGEDGTIYAALSEDGLNSSLYTISAITADVSYIGDFAGGVNAIALAPIPEPSTYAAIAGLAALAFVAYRRRRQA